MNKILVFNFLLALFLLQSCESAKKGLGGGKIKSSDEFLVEKKDPLVLPPEFNKLPEPKNANSESNTNASNLEIEKIINIQKNNNNIENSSSSGSLEQSILKKIK